MCVCACVRACVCVVCVWCARARVCVCVRACAEKHSPNFATEIFVVVVCCSFDMTDQVVHPPNTARTGLPVFCACICDATARHALTRLDLHPTSLSCMFYESYSAGNTLPTALLLSRQGLSSLRSPSSEPRLSSSDILAKNALPGSSSSELENTTDHEMPRT